MARKMILVDDLDDTEGSDIKTIDFSLEGKSYEIDLNLKNAAKLRDLMGPFIAAARRPTASAPKAKAAAPKTDTAQLQAIRDWWNNQPNRTEEDKVSNRGRIPGHVEEAFHNRENSAPAKKAPAKKASPQQELVEA